MKNKIGKFVTSIFLSVGLMQFTVADYWYVPEKITNDYTIINAQRINDIGTVAGISNTYIPRAGGSGTIKNPVIRFSDGTYRSDINISMPFQHIRINNNNQIAMRYYDKGDDITSIGVGFFDPNNNDFFDIGDLDTNTFNSMEIGNINDFGNIVGTDRHSITENSAFVWLDKNIIDINMADPNIELGESRGVAINNNNLVVGTFRVNNGDTKIFTFKNNEITVLDTPVECTPSTTSSEFTAVRVLSLNNNNEIAGDCNTSTIFNNELTTQRAFIIDVDNPNVVNFLQLPDNMNSRSVIDAILDNGWALIRGSEKASTTDYPGGSYLHNRNTGYTKAIQSMKEPNIYVEDFGIKNINEKKDILLVDNVILRFVENLPPYFNNITAQIVDENQQLSYLIPGSDHDQETGNIITYSSTDLPSGAALDANSGSFQWTPDSSQSGLYTIQITVTDNAIPSEKATAILEVTVNDTVGNQAPTANAGSNQSMHVGDPILLDGSASSDDNTASADLAYAWAFTSVPTGSNAVLVDAITLNPTFVSDLPGDYVIELTVTDEGGLNSTASVTASSTNSAPTADAGSAQGTYVGNLVSLDGSSSSDSDGDVITYVWSFVSQPVGSNITINDASTVNATFVPSHKGEYVLQLLVNDGYIGSDPSEVVVSIISADAYAQLQVIDALNMIGQYDAASFTAKGDQKSLSKKLQNVLKHLGKDNLLEAIDKLTKAIERVDGCNLRDTPDVKGMNPNETEDFINNCTDQEPVYTVLFNALNALT